MTTEIERTNKDIEAKKEIIKHALELQPEAVEEQINLAQYRKIPYSKLAALGTAFEPVTAAFQFVISGGEATSGLYWVSVPKGGHLAKFKDGSGYLGSVLKPNNAIGGGQARLNPLIMNPTMIFVAASLLSIDQKLNRIQEKQKELLEYLVQQDRAEIKGSLKFLDDILKEYKFNWDSKKFKDGNYIKVLDIRQKSEEKIVLYEEQIQTLMNKKSFLRSSQDVKQQMNDIKCRLGDYRLAVYMFAFASYLEVLLLENFDEGYLNRVVEKIEDHSFRYRELYTRCYDKIEGNAKHSVQANLIKGFAQAERIAGEAIAKVPVISRSQLDENLIEAGEKLHQSELDKAESAAAALTEAQSSHVRPFVEGLNQVNFLYNQPIRIVFDKDNLYLAAEEEK